MEDWYAVNAGGNGQDVQANLLGNLLRIDVDGSTPYEIPPDNPFAGGAGCADGCDEIYAYGFRNPYRFSFDMVGARAAGRRRRAGAVGGGVARTPRRQLRLERQGGELLLRRGEQHGVAGRAVPNAVSGSHPHAGTRLVRPVIEYAHVQNPRGGLGVVVIGGHVYRGSDVRQLRGRYVFGDFSRGFSEPDGTLFAATSSRRGLWRMQELAVANFPGRRLGHFVLGFGQDAAGEVYVLTSDSLGPAGSTGRVYRITRPGRGEGPQ